MTKGHVLRKVQCRDIGQHVPHGGVVSDTNSYVFAHDGGPLVQSNFYDAQDQVLAVALYHWDEQPEIPHNQIRVTDGGHGPTLFLIPCQL